MKILMVCLGNICRSPLAEGILSSKIKLHNLTHTVDSAGTSSYHIGDPPDIRSIETAANHGIDISHQRARKLRSIDFEEYDLLYAMDVHNYNDLMNHAHEHEKHKIKMILNESFPNQNRNVPDPYYGGDNGFELVYQMLDEACEQIVLNQLIHLK